MKNIPRPCSHTLPSLIRDLKLTLNDDLHLVISIRVDQRLPFFKTVQAAGDGFFGVKLLA